MCPLSFFSKNLIQILPLRLLIPNGPKYERVPWVVAADVCMLVLGALGGLVPNRAASLCCIMVSCCFFVVTMNGLDAFLAHTQSCCQWLVDLSVTFQSTALTSVERTNPQSRSVQLALMRAPAFTSQQQQNVKILRLLRVWVLCTWSLFPVVYALAESHCIDDFTEESLYFFGDLVAKVLLSAAMQSLNLGALDASMDVKSLVEQEAHNEAHRQRRILTQRQGLMEMDANEKDNFLRYVFHEIRIPLNSLILGVQDLTSMPLLDAAVLDTVRMMSQAASYIPHLLDDVLSLQKITSGKYVLECNPGSLQQMVLAAMSMMASTINQKQLHIAYYLDPHLPLLCTDFHLLRQVVANFLSNGQISKQTQCSRTRSRNHACIQHLFVLQRYLIHLCPLALFACCLVLFSPQVHSSGFAAHHHREASTSPAHAAAARAGVTARGWRRTQAAQGPGEHATEGCSDRLGAARSGGQ